LEGALSIGRQLQVCLVLEQYEARLANGIYHPRVGQQTTYRRCLELQVCKTLKNFGDHVQYSVFECQLKREDFRRLEARLKKLINAREDSVRFYFLCEEDVGKVRGLGVQRVEQRSPFYVV
jgi:CRISPR-associated protein Cas2